MSQTTEFEQNRQLAEYVLGLLPEAETERLDEASICDDDTAAQLHAVENDLVDAYVAGLLDAEWRERFEAHYFTTPRRRERVHFARRFLAAVDRAAAVPAPSQGSGGQPARVMRFTRPPDLNTVPARSWKFLWRVATAASLVIATVLVVNDVRLRRGSNTSPELATAESRRDEVSAQPHSDAGGQQLQSAQNDEWVQTLPVTREQSSPSRPANLDQAKTINTAIVLLPQTRSIEQPPIVELAAGATSVAFELRLEANDFERYRAALKDWVSGGIVWQSATVKSQSSGASFVSVLVPSIVLHSQHYLFELAGIDAYGREITVSSYAIEIKRP